MRGREEGRLGLGGCSWLLHSCIGAALGIPAGFRPWNNSAHLRGTYRVMLGHVLWVMNHPSWVRRGNRVESLPCHREVRVTSQITLLRWNWRNSLWLGGGRERLGRGEERCSEASCAWVRCRGTRDPGISASTAVELAVDGG